MAEHVPAVLQHPPDGEARLFRSGGNIAVVAAVTYQRLGKHTSLAHLLGHQPHPDVVGDEVIGKWQGMVQQLAAEGHATAHMGVAQQVVPETGLRMVKREEVSAQVLALAVNQPGVVGHKQVTLQKVQAGADLPGHPQVVLVGKKHVVTPHLPQRVLEIVHETVPLVVEQADAGIAQPLDDRQGGIGRTVVGDDQLVVGAELRKDGLQLRQQVTLAVVCGHADRNHGMSFFRNGGCHL